MTGLRAWIALALAAIVAGAGNFLIHLYFLNRVTRATLSDQARTEIANFTFSIVLPIYLIAGCVLVGAIWVLLGRRA